TNFTIFFCEFWSKTRKTGFLRFCGFLSTFWFFDSKTSNDLGQFGFSFDESLPSANIKNTLHKKVVFIKITYFLKCVSQSGFDESRGEENKSLRNSQTILQKPVFLCF